MSEFIQSVLAQLEVKNGQTASRYSAEVNGKETKGVFVYKESKLVDTEEFIKIYSESIDKIFVLSSAGQKVLRSLLKEIFRVKDVNRIPFDYNILTSEMGLQCSYNTYRKGVLELEQNNFIKKVSSSIWEYNAAMFFNGNRITLVKEYKLKTDKKQS